MSQTYLLPQQDVNNDDKDDRHDEDDDDDDDEFDDDGRPSTDVHCTMSLFSRKSTCRSVSLSASSAAVWLLI